MATQSKNEVSKVSKEFKWLDRWYRASKYYGSNLIEIEVNVPHGIFKDKWRWERLYMGHINPLVDSLNFFNTDL